MKDSLSTTMCAITTTTMSGDGTYIDNDTLSTLATTSATYISMNSSSAHAMEITQDYVNSMSVEQLVEFEETLAEKELEFIEIPQSLNEKPKEYIKNI